MSTVVETNNMSTEQQVPQMTEPVEPVVGVPVEPVVEQTVFNCLDTDTVLSVQNDIRTNKEALDALKTKLSEVRKRDAYEKKNNKNDPKRTIKKEKKVRQPGTKRRALSSYICFVKSLSGPERPPLAEIAARWKSMSDDDKAPFVNESQKDAVLAEQEAAKERDELAAAN